MTKVLKSKVSRPTCAASSSQDNLNAYLSNVSTESFIVILVTGLQIRFSKEECSFGKISQLPITAKGIAALVPRWLYCSFQLKMRQSSSYLAIMHCIKSFWLGL